MAHAADTTRAARTAAAIEAMNQFRFNSTTPFNSSAEDLAHDALEAAHAVSIALSIFLDRPDHEDTPLRNVHASGLASTIGTLIALGAFAAGAGE